MPQTQVTPSSLLIGRPKCPKCGIQMALTRIEPDKPDYDRRTFDCPSCDHVENVVVRYTPEATAQ